ncbi:glycosyltransferase [Streptomyces sp. NPDC047014]|uniref:glycosyltransferase n=1 Tax=Streptomyces sp. NPDC047014 TaxID=3155736 RepID=UPI0033FCBDF1
MKPTLVLVERNAHLPSGHHHGALIALASAHQPTVVIVPNGVTAETRTALVKAQAQVVDRPHGTASRILTAAARATEATADVALALFRSRHWPRKLRRAPHQITALARCLTESAAVRAGRFVAGSHPVTVLSAGEALHTTAGLFGGPHARYVHEINTTEDSSLRLLGKITRRVGDRVTLLAPTDQVRDDLAALFPYLPCRTRPFAVADSGDRISETERCAARQEAGLKAADRAVCLVGGWWPSKDFATIDAALHRITRPLTVLVIGAPLDEQLLRRWRSLPRVRLQATHAAATQAQIRSVYAAADATVLARHPGVGKESGLLADAVRLGVPLLASDHDPSLSERLRGRDWARMFPVGDASALAEQLDRLSSSLPRRPGPNAAQQIGIPTAAEQAAFLVHLPH